MAVKKKVVNKKQPRKKNYLNNKDLLAQVIESKKKGEMTNELAKMLTMLCARYAKKGNFANYTYNDDMQAYAMLMLVRTWNSFNPEKSQNPFAFFTQCVKNSFIQYLNQEKRQRDIKDTMLVDQGLTPSFSFQMEYEKKLVKEKEQAIDDEEDFEQTERTYKEQAKTEDKEDKDELLDF